MDSSSLLYLAVFFFILGAGIIGLVWVLFALFRSVSRKGKDSLFAGPNMESMAHLMRDTTNQELVVEMEGKTFESVNELSPTQLKRLGFISGVLAKWLEPAPPVDTPEVASQVPQPEQVAPEQPPEPFATPSSDEQSSALDTEPAAESSGTPTTESPSPINDWIPAETIAVASLDHHVPPFTPEPEPEVKPVSTQITDVVSGIFNPTPAPAPAFKSIAMQINDLLQEKIADTQFEKRGISVSDGPDHGVLVTLDGKKYSGVKEVPDEEVRTLLRSVVLDWEKQGKSASK
jgi:hypothetical protein